MGESEAQRKARRRSARVLVATYHEAKLAELVEHAREGFDCYDAGEIDAFELDDLVHRYTRAARELWRFCGQTGGDVERAAGMLEWMAAEGEAIDWWERGASRRRRG